MGQNRAVYSRSRNCSDVSEIHRLAESKYMRDMIAANPCASFISIAKKEGRVGPKMRDDTRYSLTEK